jgi:hypothetical protein
MDDYHELYHVHDVEIEKWCVYWSPHYFSITMDQVITFNNVATLSNHFKSSTTVFPTLSVTMIMARVLLTFNPIIKFFKELHTNC